MMSIPCASAAAPDPSELGSIAAATGLHRIHILAWRDLDDPEAGGSELHAAQIASAWADASLDVTMRSSSVAGHPAYSTRDGYRVVRKAGRYAVFPRTAVSGLVGRTGQRDAMVRHLLSASAIAHASAFTWAATARSTLEVLATNAGAHKTARATGDTPTRPRRALTGR